MARKWSNRNLPGALHFATGNFQDRVPVFTRYATCQAYIDVLASKRQEWPFKLVAYVLMPDHFHLIVNPRDGRIRELTGALKSLSAQAIVSAAPDLSFTIDQPKANQSEHKVWQESFKDLPLWSDWMIWQKINYMHFSPVKAGLVKSAGDYQWSSFRSFYLREKDVPIESIESGGGQRMSRSWRLPPNSGARRWRTRPRRKVLHNAIAGVNHPSRPLALLGTGELE